MVLQVKMVLTEDELRILAGKANFLRENPRKRWSDKEYREAARAAVEQMVKDTLTKAHALGQLRYGD